MSSNATQIISKHVPVNWASWDCRCGSINRHSGNRESAHARHVIRLLAANDPAAQQDCPCTGSPPCWVCDDEKEEDRT